jgi:hypothetical protein
MISNKLEFPNSRYAIKQNLPSSAIFVDSIVKWNTRNLL